MYLARFCYDVLPVNRQRRIEFIHREVEAAPRQSPQCPDAGAADVRPR